MKKTWRIAHFLRRHRWWMAGVMVALLVAAVTWRCWPSTASTIRRSTCIVECRSWYELSADGKAVFFFQRLDGDSLPCSMALRRDSAWLVSRSAGCWVHRWPVIPSCLGRLVTAHADTLPVIDGDGTATLAACRRAIGRRLARLKTDKDELDYFLRSHGVQDEGFPMVADYDERTTRELHLLRRVAARIDSLPATAHLALRRKAEYKVYFRDLRGRLHTRPCARRAVSVDSTLALLQTAHRLTPIGAHAQALMPWSPPTDGGIVATAHSGLAEPQWAQVTTRPQIVAGTLHGGCHDLPRVLVADGEPVFSREGRFLGLAFKGRLIGRARIGELF